MTRDYRLRAELEKFEMGTPQLIPNSSGGNDVYIRYAKVKFTLKDQAFELIVYKNPRADNYNKAFFIPFLDLTSGEETYEIGRYLNNLKVNKEDIFLDFNLASNPYCAYSSKYTCVLAPKENQLNIPIEAGEKRYQKNE